MLRLLALTCVLAVAAAQQSYFCTTSPTSIIRDRDFYLTTRSSASDAVYQAGLTCDFNAESNTGGFMVEIESFRVSTAVVTISSGVHTLFRGSSIQSYQSAIATPSKSLQVRFDASGDFSRSGGVKIRVRAFDVNGCPSGWTYLSGNCFGTNNSTGSVNYVNAQRACNSMRSNLLHVPSQYSSNIGSFVRMLPSHLRSTSTWIGLTDKTSWGRFFHYWLNGDRQFTVSEIGCASTGSYLTCFESERCGLIFDGYSRYAVYMDNCISYRRFACSAPPGGTSIYYQIPGESTIISVTIAGWVWGVVVAGVFVVGLIIVGIYTGVRSSNARRNPGAASVVVSTGRVTIPPPSTAYPAQQQPYPQLYPQQYPPQYPPQYPQPQQYPQSQPYPNVQATSSATPYNAAGNGNAAFQSDKGMK